MQQKPVEALIVFNISFTKLKVRITEHTDYVIFEVFTNKFQLQKQPPSLYQLWLPQSVSTSICLNVMSVRDVTFVLYLQNSVEPTQNKTLLWATS